MRKIFIPAALLPFLAVFAGSIPRPLAELVAAERRFSETCGRVGIRDSFLEFFADDVVTLGAELQKGKARLQQLPAGSPDGPMLQWEPVYGDISAGGDLGYTTGPYMLLPKAGQPEYGVFFSIWKRQVEGKWNVVLDAGLRTPKPEGNMGREFQPAPRVVYKKAARPDPHSSLDELADTERRFADTAALVDLGRALLIHGDPSLRLHRAGSPPMMGSERVGDYLKQHPMSYRCEPLGSGVASSGDMGFVYGRYDAMNIADRGFYVRVWRRNEQGQWRVVLDSMHPAAKN